MPELRIDPLSGLRTIVAGARADRPGGGFAAEPRPPIEEAGDPFLEGHERRTPPELHALRPDGGAADAPGWLVRVVPNLYPALEKGGDAAGDGASGGVDPLAADERNASEELFPARPATGAHEVIVNAPRPEAPGGPRAASRPRTSCT